MVMTASERITNVGAFARAWCAARGFRFGAEATEDIVQEAYVAALMHDHDRRAIVRAMDSFRKREYRRPTTFSSLGDDWDGDDFVDRAEEHGFSPEDLGLHWDDYHGWCRDDV